MAILWTLVLLWCIFQLIISSAHSVTWHVRLSPPWRSTSNSAIVMSAHSPVTFVRAGRELRSAYFAHLYYEIIKNNWSKNVTFALQLQESAWSAEAHGDPQWRSSLPLHSGGLRLLLTHGSHHETALQKSTRGQPAGGALCSHHDTIFSPFSWNLLFYSICAVLLLFQQGNMVSRYKCHLCDKNFSWCYTLTLHLRKKHQLKWPSGHSRFRYLAHNWCTLWEYSTKSKLISFCLQWSYACIAVHSHLHFFFKFYKRICEVSTLTVQQVSLSYTRIGHSSLWEHINNIAY